MRKQLMGITGTGLTWGLDDSVYCGTSDGVIERLSPGGRLDCVEVEGWVDALATLPDGRLLVGSWVNVVRALDHDLTNLTRLPTRQAPNLWRVAVRHDGTAAWSGSTGEIQMGDRVISSGSDVTGMDWAPDGRLVTAHADGSVRYRGDDGVSLDALLTEPGRCLAVHPRTGEAAVGRPGQVLATWSPDGSLYATADRLGEVLVCSGGPDGAVAHRFKDCNGVCGLAFSHDGRRLAWVTDIYRTLRVEDVDSRPPPPDTARAMAAAALEGDRLAASSLADWLEESGHPMTPSWGPALRSGCRKPAAYWRK